MTHVFVAAPMRADTGAAATRRSREPRAALGPIESNTSSFAEASGCATPHGAGSGASFGLRTPEPVPDSVAPRRGVDCGGTMVPVPARRGGALRFRHEPYPALHLANPRLTAPSLPPGLQGRSPSVSPAPRPPAAEAAPAPLLPAGADAAAVQTTIVATVQFRFRTAPFAVPAELEHACAPGVAVVVPGDRGEDGGTVLSVKSDARAALRAAAVKRVASPADADRIATASRRAAPVAVLVRKLVADEATRNPQFGQLTVLGVDVQMDQKKVSVHYTSPWRVQFGKFASRVWHSLPIAARVEMNQVNYARAKPMPRNDRAPRPSVGGTASNRQQQREGTPVKALK
jgi:hypothetical protein